MKKVHGRKRTITERLPAKKYEFTAYDRGNRIMFMFWEKEGDVHVLVGKALSLELAGEEHMAGGKGMERRAPRPVPIAPWETRAGKEAVWSS